jgi:hypothetical protein
MSINPVQRTGLRPVADFERWAKMKTYLLSSVLIAMMSLTVFAEMQFPAFESLSEKDQKAWGYTIHRNYGNNPSISISIPAAAAKYCQAIRLYTKNKKGRLLTECNIAPLKNADGSLGITLNVFEDLEGYSELIVYTTEVPGAPRMGDFGGFTFLLSKGSQ